MIKPSPPKQNLIIAGIGFSSKASADDIIQAVQRAVHDNGLDLSQLDYLACLESKRRSEPLKTAAQELGLALVFIDQSMAKLAAKRGATRSKRSLRATGLPSASEAAALAAAGAASTLLDARTCHGPVTCALAINRRAHPSNQAARPVNDIKTLP